LGKDIPLLHEEGWLRLKKISRSLLSAADGVVETDELLDGGILDHPVRSIKGGFAASSLCRVHPSSWRRGMLSPKHFGNTAEGRGLRLIRLHTEIKLARIYD
jgi:hypothetical protein